MNRLSYIYNKVSSGQFLYAYAVVALLLPNIALCYTECLTPWACGVNVLLPLSLYMLFFSAAKRPGKMVWWAFIFVFFAAFQLVLLYLFGTGVIAVDMFLNLVTTNPGEAMELLDNLAPAVVGVFVVYLPLLILGGCQYQKRLPVVGFFPAESPPLGNADWGYRTVLSAGKLSGGG